MKRRIRITGSRVHDIGYRYFLMENALAFGIERFRAVNIEDSKQVVEVYVDGEDEVVKEFCRFVESNFPPDAVVDEVRVEEYAGYVPRMEAFALVFNIGQSRKFIEYGKQVLGKQDKMLEKQDTMLGKMDKMLEKQDETIKAVKDVGEKVDKVAEKVDEVGRKVDKVGEKVDRVGEKVDRVGEKVDKVGEKVDALRQDLKVSKLSLLNS